MTEHKSNNEINETYEIKEVSEKLHNRYSRNYNKILTTDSEIIGQLTQHDLSSKIRLIIFNAVYMENF